MCFMYHIGKYAQRCDARRSAGCAGELLTSLALYSTVCSNIQLEGSFSDIKLIDIRQLPKQIVTTA
jgi:hypothetical protein